MIIKSTIYHVNQVDIVRKFVVKVIIFITDIKFV